MTTEAMDIYNNDVIIQSLSLFNEQKVIIADLIIGDENESYVADILGDNKAQRVAIEKERKRLLDPINKDRNTILNTFREILSPMEELDRDLRNKMSKYLHEKRIKEEQIVEKQRLEELEELQEKKDTAQAELERTGDADKADEVEVIDAKMDNVQHATIKSNRGAAGKESKSNVSYIWSYEIEDENKIPRQYMMPNTTLIGNVVRSKHGVRKIKGIKIFQKAVVSTKRRI